MTKSQRNALYYVQNRDRILERQKANPNRLKNAKKYRDSHKFSVTSLKSKQVWRDENKSYIRKYNKQYYNGHKCEARIRCSTRRTRKTQAGGSYTVEQWIDLCSREGNACLACRKKLPLEADHVIPISKGGTSNISNIQPLCRSCNVKKGTNIIDFRRGEMTQNVT